MDQERGVYFADEPDHEYGRYVYRCRLTMSNALMSDSEDAFEIDRHLLMSQGYDGRIVDYTKENDGGEMFDYIVFNLSQIEILEVTDTKA